MASHGIYRGFEIWHMRNSTPPSDGDWEFSHIDYDGAEDANDDRLGWGRSLEDCMAQIDAMLDKAPPMDAINDGGPAFPIPHIYGSDGCGLHEGAPGMSQREYFAGLAMQGLLAQTPTAISAAELAREAILCADALIAALATRKTEGA